MRDGDELVVSSIDRLARSLTDLRGIVDERECLMVCVWVPNPHEEMDQNDYCGTTRSG